MRKCIGARIANADNPPIIMKMRNFSPSDLKAMLAIQAESPEASQWTAPDYERLANEKGGLVLVAQIAPYLAIETVNSKVIDDASEPPGTLPSVVGFAAAFSVEGEAELRNLAVTPVWRRHGVAAALLRELHERLRLSRISAVFLEVRVSNLPARQLYEIAGYLQANVRKSYYSNPAEDAIVLRLAL